MSIDLESETAITIAEAAQIAPGRPHVATIWRWMQRGVRGVRLETVVCGGRRFTSRQALDRFFVGTTAAAAGEPAPIRTPAQRRRAIAAAEAALAADGI